MLCWAFLSSLQATRAKQRPTTREKEISDLMVMHYSVARDAVRAPKKPFLTRSRSALNTWARCGQAF